MTQEFLLLPCYGRFTLSEISALLNEFPHCLAKSVEEVIITHSHGNIPAGE
jgi:hypothetical protein